MVVDENQMYMNAAYQQAEAAFMEDEVPVGAVIVKHGRVIAAAYNQREQLHDPTAHAEMIAITQAAGAVGDWRLDDCVLYVTLEPCPMCAGAIIQSRIPRVVFGAADPKAGAVVSMFNMLNDRRMNHQTDFIQGVQAQRCGEILTRFFEKKRLQGKK